MKKIIMSLVIVVTLFLSPVFAGNPAQSSQSGQSSQSSHVGQHHGHQGHHHGCLLKKFKKQVKKAVKKAKRCGHKAYDSAKNKVMDAGVKAKKTLTCKKNRTWVKGHYTKNGRHVRGYWRKVGHKR